MAVDEEPRRILGKSVQLPIEQWRWLEARSEANYSRSVSAELRRLIAGAMEAEREAVPA